MKRKTKDILSQVHKTGRPVVLTLNGKAEAVLVDPKIFETLIKSITLSGYLKSAEKDISAGNVKSAKSFFKDFKRTNKISS